MTRETRFIDRDEDPTCTACGKNLAATTSERRVRVVVVDGAAYCPVCAIVVGGSRPSDGPRWGRSRTILAVLTGGFALPSCSSVDGAILESVLWLLAAVAVASMLLTAIVWFSGARLRAPSRGRPISPEDRRLAQVLAVERALRVKIRDLEATCELRARRIAEEQAMVAELEESMRVAQKQLTTAIRRGEKTGERLKMTNTVLRDVRGALERRVRGYLEDELGECQADGETLESFVKGAGDLRNRPLERFRPSTEIDSWAVS